MLTWFAVLLTFFFKLFLTINTTLLWFCGSGFSCVYLKLHIQYSCLMFYYPLSYSRSCVVLAQASWLHCGCLMSVGVGVSSPLDCTYVHLNYAIITDVIVCAVKYRCSGFLDKAIENHYILTEGDSNTQVDICSLVFIMQD